MSPPDDPGNASLLKRVALLGSTGSIGTQALEVLAGLGTFFVVALSAQSNAALLADQARATGARMAALTDTAAAEAAAPEFDEMGVELYRGREGLLEMIRAAEFDIALNSIVGSAGLAPTLEVLEKGSPLALANKESLVAGGNLVMETARRNRVEIIPVDSEHSAIFQCLRGERASELNRIILTASGGPFRDSPADLSLVTVEDALAHPTWSMGRKVTIDSATLMNKGLEVLEACHLFQAGIDRVDVLVHPQSIVHSMVEMVDGSVLAHLGVPDMRIPIQYALTYPERAPSPAQCLSLDDVGALTFRPVDRERFPCLDLAYEAGRAGGTCPAALNAANEEAVAAFLGRRLRFTDIPRVISAVLEGHRPLSGKELGEITLAEEEARRAAGAAISEMGA